MVSLRLLSVGVEDSVTRWPLGARSEVAGARLTLRPIRWAERHGHGERAPSPGPVSAARRSCAA